jgi:adenosylmethionine-8-amino-7-oxononanoate aminotransferase
VRDQETLESLDDAESEELLKGFVSHELYDRGLICRSDDRGDPVIQLSPPLTCDTEQFEEIAGILRPVLEEAWERLSK